MDGLTTTDRGTRAEREAEAWFLKRFGGRLLERNYRTKMGEIDLIFEMSNGGRRDLVFVEVRSRQPGSWTSGIESLTPSKLRHLSLAIQCYLAEYRGTAWGVRIDVLDWDGRDWAHYPGIRLD